LALREKANLARKVNLFVSDTKSQIRDWIVGYPAFAEKTRGLHLIAAHGGRSSQVPGTAPNGQFATLLMSFQERERRAFSRPTLSRQARYRAARQGEVTRKAAFGGNHEFLLFAP
jgi:hypothetical protein